MLGAIIDGKVYNYVTSLLLNNQKSCTDQFLTLEPFAQFFILRHSTGVNKIYFTWHAQSLSFTSNIIYTANANHSRHILLCIPSPISFLPTFSTPSSATILAQWSRYLSSII